VALIILIAALWRWSPAANPAVQINNLGFESLQIAYSLAHGQGFANPFADLQSGPTAHLAPVFPFLLSFVIRWFGDASRAIAVIDWMGVLAAGLQLSLWPFAARRLGMGFWSGALGAGLWLTFGLVPRTVWEADYVAVLVIVLSMAMYKILTERSSTAYIASTAAIWGLTILASPVVFLPFVVLALCGIFIGNINGKQKLVLVAIPLLVLTPWTIRNYRAFHHIFLVRDNLGLELSVSNNECAEFSLIANQLTSCYVHPNEDPQEAARFRSMGEYAYNQERLRQAVHWIAENPRRFGSLTLERAVAFWFPNGSGNPFTSQVDWNVKVLWAITLFSFPGLVLLWWRNRIAALICLIWLIFFPPVYYLIQFDVRYRTPIMWASLIPAAYLFVRVGKELFASRAGRTQPAASVER